MSYAHARKSVITFKCNICIEEATNNSELSVSGYQLYWTGPNDDSGLHGVGIAISDKLASSVMFCKPISPRVIMLRIQSKPMNFTIIGGYAPINDASDIVKDQFYAEIISCLNSTPRSDFLIAAGDWNAQLGTQSPADARVIGPFSIGTRSDNGDRLMTLLHAHELFATNTNFKHKRKHLATWKSPDGRTFNQIDHILIRQRWRSSAMDSRSYWGNDWSSDHAMVRCRLRVRFRTNKPEERTKRYNTERLKDTILRQEFQTRFQNSLVSNNRLPPWSRVCYSLHAAAEVTLGQRRSKRHPWISEGTLNLITQRRNTNDTDRLLRRDIKRSLVADKDAYWNQIADAMEHASAVGDSKKLFHIIKCSSKSKSGVSDTIKDKNGVLIETAEAKVERWKEHFDELLNRAPPTDPIDRTHLLQKPKLNIRDEAPTIDDIVKVVKTLKAGKAPGEDGIPPEFYKDGGVALTMELHKILVTVWQTGATPVSWQIAEVIPLFKKGDKALCSNYRGISLLDIALKVFEGVVIDRIKAARDSDTRENQAGFRSGRGCVDQIFALRQVIEARNEYNRPTYVGFVDFSAAFDSVDRSALWLIMEADGVPANLVSMFKAMYASTKCCVKVYNTKSTPFEVKTGVRQGGISSPMLFNWVIDWVLKTALDSHTDGVVLGEGRILTDLTFADDIALLAETPAQLQTMLDRVSDAAARVGLLISSAKTKTMICSTDQIPTFYVNGAAIENVPHFKYLGSEISTNGDGTVEIRSRIAKAQAAMSMLRCLWNNRRISIKTKKRVYMASVRPVLVYACETWPLKSEHEKKLDAFEHKMWRWILHVSYLDRVTNIEIRQRMNITETVSQAIKKASSCMARSCCSYG